MVQKVATRNHFHLPNQIQSNPIGVYTNATTPLVRNRLNWTPVVYTKWVSKPNARLACSHERES